MPLTPERIQNFWSYVDKSGDCWEWTGGVDRYGRFWTGSHSALAHRVSWELANGPVPDGLCVLHSCDNPVCVNPDHLFVGTNADNTQDALQKGRLIFPRGEHHGNSRLTEADVLAIREAARHASQAQVAAQFGTHQGTISKIVNGKLWTHLGGGQVAVGR